jgi:hypothetical protein
MTTMHAWQASLTALEESGEEPELEFHPDSFRSASQMMLFTLKRSFASSWAYVVVIGVSKLSIRRPSCSLFKAALKGPRSRFRIAMSRRQICLAVS